MGEGAAVTVIELTRLEDWETRFAAHVSVARSEPMEWRKSDCLTLAARGVHAVTGANLLPGSLRYTTARGAAMALRRMGYDTPADAVDDRLPRVAVALARRGDVAAVIRDGAVTCGSVTGRHVFVPTDGLPAFVPLTEASVAWRVGW